MEDIALQLVSSGGSSSASSSDVEEFPIHRPKRHRPRRQKLAWVRAQYEERKCKSAWLRFPFRSRRPLQLLFALSLMLVGALTSALVTALWHWTPPDPYDVAFAHFWHNRFSPSSSPGYPLDFFGSVLPVPCHSHNDYWRRTPLFAALGSGCVSIEADVWVRNGDLHVGHTQYSLRDNATLQTMYINSLVDILEVMNPSGTSHQNSGKPVGIFYNDPMQTLTLLVDFKTPGIETWFLLYNQLQPLRERGLLTHWNGTDRVQRPITVVASGAADFDILVANRTYRDIFYDAPLDDLEDESDREAIWGDLQTFKYNPSNSHLASVKFHKAIGPLWHSRLSDEQVQKLRRQIRNARERQLIPRYWGTPRWPRGLRDVIWNLLVQEEVGLLNVDDLRAVRKGQWGLWPQGGRQR